MSTRSDVPMIAAVRMSRSGAEPIGAHVADGMDVPRPQLVAAVATALTGTTVCEHVVALVATQLAADVELCEQVARLSSQQRTALRRAESQVIDSVGTGLPEGTSHRVGGDGGPDGAAEVTVVHGDGWSLVARCGPVLVFLLDVSPGLVIDRSRADGAAGLVTDLFAQPSGR